jgi:glycosyltransferase involved in cell wall biosynthesis
VPRPKISIITPSFNQGAYLEETILSVIHQDYANFEFIIIDGGSTDNTVDIIKKYQSHITYWVSEKDHGQAHAINKGLQVATGDIFNWINSDDYLEPGALTAVAEAYRADPEKKIFCGFTHCFFQETGETSHTYRMGVRRTVVETILNVEMNQPGSFYKMEVVKEMGMLNESFDYVFDGEFWFRFLCRYGLNSIAFMDDLFAHFRLHKASKSMNDGPHEFYKEYLNVHLHLLKEAGLPASFAGYLEGEQYINKYVPSSWILTHLEKKKLYDFYAARYKYLLYKDREYHHARKGLKYALCNREDDRWRLQISLLMKLAFPDFLINAVRATKHSLS